MKELIKIYVMKKFISSFLSLMLILSICLFFTSCRKETGAPAIQIYKVVEGYHVTFTAASVNTDSYAWDFGDGGSGSGQIVDHTYGMSGTFDVTCTGTGPGGTVEATREVVIAASELEMLTGGEANTEGKTWVLSQTASEGDGLYLANESKDLEIPLAVGVPAAVGIPSEFEDEYTFHYDGSFTQDPVNDSSMTGIILAMVNGIPNRVIWGFITMAPYSPVDDATFTYYENSGLTLDVTTDAAPEESSSVTWPDYSTIEIAGDAFIGFRDFTRKYIVFDISPDKLVLGVFISTTAGSNMMMPTCFVRMTFIPKE